jgi:hypothetical protein
MFMKAATRGDDPDWFRPPKGVTTARVCRLSGKLAASGCEHADVVGEDGFVEKRSTVYTEYFARGTEPTEYCDLHEGPGFFGTVAGFLTGRPSTMDRTAPPAVPSASVSGGGGGDAASAESSLGLHSPGFDGTSAEAPPSPETPKKRGFWSRIFGRRSDDRRSDGDGRSDDAKK